MNRTVVAFGGNLPFEGQPPSHTFSAALAYLTTDRGHQLRSVARLWRSRPVDADGPDFLNTVAWIDTPLAPEAWLQCLLETELHFGRQRPECSADQPLRPPHGARQVTLRPQISAARPLDLDLIWCEGLFLQTPALTLPHPRAASRAFVLGPLLDLEKGLTDLRLPCPESGRPLPVSSLWTQLPAAARADVVPVSSATDWPAATILMRPAAPAQDIQECGLA